MSETAPEPLAWRDMRPDPLADFTARREQIRPMVQNRLVVAAYDRALDRVDPRKVAELQDRYRDEVARHHVKSFLKYLDMPFWAMTHAGKAHHLRLLQREPVKLLDIGSGGGSFLAVNAAAGHEVLGIDCAEPELYGELCDAWGVERVARPVQAGEALDARVGRFHVITGLSVVLGPDHGGFAGVDEWLSFFNRLSDSHLLLPGEIHFELNVLDRRRQPRLDPAIFEACAERGAEVDFHRGLIRFQLDRPTGFQVGRFVGT